MKSRHFNATVSTINNWRDMYKRTGTDTPGTFAESNDFHILLRMGKTLSHNSRKENFIIITMYSMNINHAQSEYNFN